jgi:hypothetical protein
LSVKSSVALTFNMDVNSESQTLDGTGYPG